MSNLDRSCV